MYLENKLKQAALAVAIHHQTRDRKARERTCRNMIELGQSLSKTLFSESALDQLYKELIQAISEMSEEDIKKWMIRAFQLE